MTADIYDRTEGICKDLQFNDPENLDLRYTT